VDQILQLVGNMSSLDDRPVRVDTGYASQLQSIAEVHKGKVPLHGRLFAQWLHYVFPHECAFPHRSGTVRALAPAERGDDSLASQDEVERHASANITSDEFAANAGLDAMSQWTEDEEFLVDYSIYLHGPPQHNQPLIIGSVVLLLAAAALTLAVKLPGYKVVVVSGDSEQNGKLHFV